MNWINFFLQSSILFLLFYSIYWLFLKEETYHKINRGVLLSIILVVIALPLMPVPEPVAELKAQYMPPELNVFAPQAGVIEIAEPDINQEVAVVQSISVAEPTIQWHEILFYLYLTGVILLGLRFVFSLISILGLLIWSDLRSSDGLTMAFSEKEFQPFSFFNFVFIGKDDHSESARDHIIIHESVHAQEWHSFDLILVELFSIIFWFHPFTGMLKRSIKLNLEYIADEAVLRTGANRKAYQYSLLKVSTAQKNRILTNSFNHSYIKKRIIMMNLQKSPEWKKLKYLLFLPLFLMSYTFLSTANAQTVKETSTEDVSIEHKINEEKLKLAEKRLIEKYERANKELEKLELDRELARLKLQKAQIAYEQAQIAQGKNEKETEVAAKVAQTQLSTQQEKLMQSQKQSAELQAVLAQTETQLYEIQAVLAEEEHQKLKAVLAEREAREVEQRSEMQEKLAMLEEERREVEEDKATQLEEENVYVVIRSNTTKEELLDIQRDIKKYGIYFRYPELEFDEEGAITRISLAVKTNSGFSGNAFSYNNGGGIDKPVIFYKTTGSKIRYGVTAGINDNLPKDVKSLVKKMTGYFKGNWH